MSRDVDDKHAWWKSWEDKTTNRNMRRWIRLHGHWIAWAWESCCKLANDPQKDGRLCNRKSGDQYDAGDVADEALISVEQAEQAFSLFIDAEWMHRDDDGCLVVTRFYDRNVDADAQRKRKQRTGTSPGKEAGQVTGQVTGNVAGRVTVEDRGQRTEDRGQNNPPTPQEGEGVSVPVPDSKQAKANSAFDTLATIWREYAVPAGLPPCRKGGKAPAQALAALNREPSLDYWRDAAQALASDPHCLGQNDREWIATFGWYLKDPDGKVSGRVDRYRARGSTPVAMSEADKARKMITDYAAQQQQERLMP